MWPLGRLTCPFSSLIGLALPSWTLWLFLACLLALPVFAALVEDRPPRNELTQEQPGDDEAEMSAAA